MENALSTVLTKEHNEINNLFVNKIISLLQSGDFELTQYGVESQTYQNREQVSLRLAGGQDLSIFLYTPKN